MIENNFHELEFSFEIDYYYKYYNIIDINYMSFIKNNHKLIIYVDILKIPLEYSEYNKNIIKNLSIEYDNFEIIFLNSLIIIK